MKVENAIYEEYREAIEAAEQRLIDAKAEQLKGVRSMVERKHAGGINALITEVFTLWKDDIEEAKFNREAGDKIAAMEAKLKACNDHAAESAKKVMARCGAASGTGLRDMCFHEWINYHQDYLKNKELEDAVKAEEARIAEFMKSHSENAKGLLNNMHAATNTGLLHEVLTLWYEFYKEEKQINEYAEIMNAGNSKFGAFGDRNKKGAQSVMERAHEHNIIMLYLKVWGAWRLDTRSEQAVRKQQVRIEGKRKQLLGVQQMFRDFAKQLESNIQAGVDSSRDLAAGPPSGYRKRKGMQKGDGSVSLPDINSYSNRPSSRPTGGRS